MPVDKPKERLVYSHFTQKYAAHWKRIGNLLGVDEITLEKIACDGKSSKACFNELWKMWLSENTNASWNNVIEIISLTDLLQKIYIDERNIDRFEIWTSNLPEQFANVSILCHKERCATVKQPKDLTKAIHSDKLNIAQLSDSYVSNCKTTSSIFDIFGTNTSQDKKLPHVSNVILIEGGPGIGKTILSKEIAFQWASENLLCNTHVLFLVQLHDPQILQIKSLPQLICYAIKLTPDNQLVKTAVDYLESNLGQHCTMVFDGYDEISEKVRKDSLVANIIARKILPLCCLVITSHPFASIDLHRIADRRVEILGFTKDDRNKYIQKNLQEKEVEKLQEYLQNNPFISNLCYIPLNMTMLLCLFKELTNPDSPPLPKSQTDINVQFIYKTIARFISQKKKKIITIKSPDDLDISYKQHFNMLCKLAFDLLGIEMVVFNDDDIRKYIPRKSVTNWSSLGLLRETNYYSVEENEPKKSYSYLCLTIQECLAAHYIAKKVEINFLRNYFWDSRYLNAGVMYVGLTKGKSPAFKTFLLGRSKKFGIQFAADKATMYDKVKKLHFFLCLLEAENDELSEQLQVDKIIYENTIDLSNHILQQKDIHTLSFFLSRSTIKHWEKLDLSNSYLNDEGLQKFSEFSNRKFTNVSIDTIDLSHNSLSPNSVLAMVNLISCFKVKNAIITDSFVEAMEFKIALLSSCTKVERLTISSTGESSHFLINYKLNDMDQNFLDQLEFKSQLYAWNVNAFLSTSDLIMKCVTINIYEENLPDEKIDDIASELKMMCEERNKTVTYVLQSSDKVIACGVEYYQISQSLKSDSFISLNSNWKTVDMRQCNIGDKNLIKLNQVLCSIEVNNFDTLIFFKSSLKASSIPAILDILKSCAIKHFIISDDLVCNDTFCSLIFGEDSKILNFKRNMPLMLSINNTKSLFNVNFEFNDSIMKDYDCVKSHLYFSNVKLSKLNIQKFLMVCKNNKRHINVFEMDTTDEVINDVLTELETNKHNTYVLASKTRLFAQNAKQEKIMEALVKISPITTVKLVNCAISLSHSYPLGELLSNTSKNMKLIDLSGCNVKDEECLSLYECLTANKCIIHIDVLNLSSNCLTSDSVIAILKIFEHCVIKTLIISRNDDIPVNTFQNALREHLLAKRSFLNFKHKIALVIYERPTQSSYEICNVYTFQTSDMGAFLSHAYEDNTLYNLYHVKYDQKHFFIPKPIFSILLKTDEIEVSALVEGIMNEKITNMITELTKLKYGKNGELSKVTFSSIDFTDESCKLLCTSLFNDIFLLKVVKTFDFSTCKLSLACVPIITESFQYCTIKHLILPNHKVLDRISESILKKYHTGESIVNFAEGIPLTVNIEVEVEEEEKEEEDTTFAIIANTYLQNHEIRIELFDHYEDLVINQMTTSHTFYLLDCLRTNELTAMLSILYTKASYVKICMFELRLTNSVLDESVNHLRTLKKEIYRDRLQYVLASDSKIVAYNAKWFHIIQALQIKPKISDLQIMHCIISRKDLKSIAIKLIGTFGLLKNIKVTSCKIKDKTFLDFCNILSSFPKAITISLKTMDFSHNQLTSYSIGTILKLLQCSVIERLIVSNNSINDTALTDAIFQLARYKWNKVCNLNSGTPLVIINASASQQCKSITDKRRCATIFYMNCKVDNNLLVEYCSQVKKIYFLNSLVAMGDLRMNLAILCHFLPSSIKVVVYEKDLQDDTVQEAATCLTKETQIHMNFILVSKTKLIASNSSYHLIAPLLDSNPLIGSIQLKDFLMQFPNDCRFVRTLTQTSRNWELIDLSGCNICDFGCLELQQCFEGSKSSIGNLNLKYNNLSSTSAAAIASIILNCEVKKVNISNNNLQNCQVNNALSCLKQNPSTIINVEIISSASTSIIISNIDPKLIPYKLWSSNHNIHLSMMHYFQFDDVDSILSSLYNANLSLITLQNNALTLDQIECISNKLLTANLCIVESHMQYSCKYIDYSSETLIDNLLTITKDDGTSPLSSLILCKLDKKCNKIIFHDNKIMSSSIENVLTKLIHWQINTTLVAVKLSNCYVTNNIAKELASVIIEITDLKLFELSFSHIQESDLKVILEALQSTISLNIFTIKSIDCFIEDTAEVITSITSGNNEIQYLEISNCNMKQSTILKIAKSIKELHKLKQLNLSGIPLTREELDFVLRDKCSLEQLNLSHCKLKKLETVKISLDLKSARISSINLSHNIISDYAAETLVSLLRNQSVNYVDMSNCNLQEKGMSCIINTLKHKSLKYLNFSGNKINDLLATELSAGISNNPYITELDLSNCNLQEIGTVEIFTSLKEHLLHLKSFKVSSLISTEETVSLFEGILDNNKNIENLTLHSCDCGRIFNALRKNVSTLQFLDISSSTISFKNLISIIANNINMKHLDISNCDVQDESDLSYTNLSGLFLEHLNLSGIKITKTFAKYISKLIYGNKLKHLDIASCEMEESELTEITNSLTLLNSLNHFNCSNNVISPQVANKISEVITNNVHLEHLDISLCFLTEQTFSPITNALKNLQALKCFNVSSNYIMFDKTSFKLSRTLSEKSSDKEFENAILNDYYTISIAPSKLIARNSSTEELGYEPIRLDQRNNPAPTDKTDISTYLRLQSEELYNTFSIASSEVSELYTTIPQGNDIMPPSCIGTNVKDHNAMDDSISLDKNKASFPYHSTSTDAEDYDTMSTGASSEITLQNSDKMSENASLNLDDDIVAVDDITVESDRNSESSLHDHSYEAVSMIYECNSRPCTEYTSEDGYDIVPETDEIMSTYLSNRFSTYSYLELKELRDTSLIVSGEAAAFYSTFIQRNDVMPYISTQVDDYNTVPLATSIYDVHGKYEDTTSQTDMTTTEYYSTNVLNSTLVDDYGDISSTTVPKHSSNNGLENIPVDCDENASAANSVVITKLTEVINCSYFLECLDISNCKLSDLDIATIALALSKTSTLKCLNLSCNEIIDDNTALKIASVITNNLSLKKINLSSCNLQENGIVIISDALAKLTSVAYIDLSKNNITDNSTQSVAAAVTENLLLEHLNISYCFKYCPDVRSATNEKGVKVILMPLTMVTCLKYLNLHSSYVNEVASELLPVVIANNTSLSHLDLTDCKLRETVLITVAEALKSMDTLEFLSLSSNVVTNEAAYEIALAVSKNYSLQHLALSGCEFEERGLMDVARSLLNTSSIMYLDLSYNIISYEVSKILASSISKNMKLTHLDLSFCAWQNYKSFTRICEAVSKLSRIKEVDLRSP